MLTTDSLLNISSQLPWTIVGMLCNGYVLDEQSVIFPLFRPFPFYVNEALNGISRRPPPTPSLSAQIHQLASSSAEPLQAVTSQPLCSTSHVTTPFHLP